MEKRAYDRKTKSFGVRVPQGDVGGGIQRLDVGAGRTAARQPLMANRQRHVKCPVPLEVTQFIPRNVPSDNGQLLVERSRGQGRRRRPTGLPLTVASTADNPFPLGAAAVHRSWDKVVQ